MYIRTNNSGLPSNEVTCIEFDKNGNTWVGTEGAGVARYDGVNWTYFTTQNSNLLSDTIADIKEQKSTGDIFIGTQRYGINILSGNTMLSFDTTVLGLRTQKTSIGWIDRFFIEFDSNDDAYTIGNKIYKYNGNQWVVYGDLPTHYYDSTQKAYVNEFAFDKTDNIWTHDGRFYNGLNWVLPFPHLNPYLSSIGVYPGYPGITMDGTGKMNFVVTFGHNAYIYSMTTNSYDSVYITQESLDYNGLLRTDLNGHVWSTFKAATYYSEHLYIISGSNVTSGPFHPDSSNVYVRDIDFDNKGNVWVALSSITGNKSNHGSGILVYNDNGLNIGGIVTEINEFQVNSNNGLRVFPNPASEILNLNFDIPVTGEIQLLSADGSKLYNISISKEKELQLEVPNSIQNGVYVVSVNSKSLNTKKLVLIKK